MSSKTAYNNTTAGARSPGTPGGAGRRFNIHSLSARLIGVLCLMLVLVIGTTTFIHYRNMQSSLIQALDSKAQSKLNSLAPLSASYLSNFELDLVRQLGAGVQVEDEVGYVVIAGANGKDYYRDDATARREHTRVYEREISANGKHYGKIEIGFDTAPLQAKLHQSMLYSLGIGLFAVLTGVLAAIFLSRSITRPLNRMSAMLEDIAGGAGDLTQRLDERARNELGTLAHWFNVFIGQLQAIIGQVSHCTDQVASAVQHVGEIAEQTNRAADEQQAMTAHMVTAMTQMAATVEEVSRSATDTAHFATTAGQQADQGQDTVASTRQTIAELATKMGHASEVIARLGEECENIGGILTIIQGIADHINLLALNAAIEAARAGEHGRGFAIVASEVRDLAGRTRQSTLEITTMVERLQVGAHRAVQAMQEGQGEVEASVQRVGDASSSLAAITQSAHGICDRSAQIACSTEEQTKVAEDVNRNIVRINEISINTLQGAHMTAQASEELDRLAGELRALMRQFRV